MNVVTDSAELRRILALPRREIDFENALDLTCLFRVPGGTMRLFPVQSVCLLEAAECGGLFGVVEVGGGKTLIALLMAEAMDSRKTVILTRAKLRDQMLEEARGEYGEHFRIPLDRIVVASYNQLSNPDTGDLLERERPDLVVADESHCLRNLDATGTGRLFRYLSDEPGCRFVALTGTPTSRSVMDYAHVVEAALGAGSPVPRGYRELVAWAGALDARPAEPCGPGALRRLGTPGESVRAAFRRRLQQTRGVVVSTSEGVDVPLVVRRLSPELPRDVAEVLDQVRETWRIGDEEIDSAATLSRVVRQVACGFYYVWDWPDGEPDLPWLAARAEWHAEVRDRLSHKVRGMDSQALLARAAERTRSWRLGKAKKKPRHVWDSTSWEAWRIQRRKKLPPRRAVWLSRYVVDYALEWLRKGGIAWYEWRALGAAFSEEDIAVYGEGVNATHATERAIACSVVAQREGRQLQRYSRNLILSMFANGEWFEQVVGRTHRTHQRAPVVEVEWLGHVPELRRNFARMIETDVRYQAETFGTSRKALIATIEEAA